MTDTSSTPLSMPRIVPHKVKRWETIPLHGMAGTRRCLPAISRSGLRRGTCLAQAGAASRRNNQSHLAEQTIRRHRATPDDEIVHACSCRFIQTIIVVPATSADTCVDLCACGIHGRRHQTDLPGRTCRFCHALAETTGDGRVLAECPRWQTSQLPLGERPAGILIRTLDRSPNPWHANHANAQGGTATRTSVAVRRVQLRTAELLAILIRTGRPGESALEAGERLANRAGEHLEVLRDHGTGGNEGHQFRRLRVRLLPDHGGYRIGPTRGRLAPSRPRAVTQGRQYGRRHCRIASGILSVWHTTNNRKNSTS